MKLYKHYVYVLSHKGVPFYIGISVNPVDRLYAHRVTTGPARKKLRSVKTSEVSINIVGHVVTKSLRTCTKCGELEHFWIKYYIKAGFELVNIANRPFDFQVTQTFEEMVKSHHGAPPQKIRKRILKESI